ncbi:hypothetical protein ACXR0O_08775 [Verrucomicrobiota bacterium sgz303538]
MPTRNTVVLQQVIEVLGDQLPAPENVLARLEEHFQDSLLIVAGNVTQVAEYAEQLRLAITTPECGLVLDYVAHESLAGIHIDQVEDAINALFPDRFIEPEP